MSHTVQDWQVDLIEVHPGLFHPPAGAEGSGGYPDCEEGWQDLLDRACNRIEAALEAEQDGEKYHD